MIIQVKVAKQITKVVPGIYFLQNHHRKPPFQLLNWLLNSKIDTKIGV